MNSFTGEEDALLPSTLTPQLAYSIDSNFDVSSDAAEKLLNDELAIIGGRVFFRNGDAKVVTSIGDTRKQNGLFCKIMNIKIDEQMKRKDRAQNVTAAKRLKNYAPVKAIVKLKGDITITPHVLRRAINSQPATVGITLRNGNQEGVVRATLRGCSEQSATTEFLQAKKDLKVRAANEEAPSASNKFGPPGCFKTSEASESEDSRCSNGEDSDVVVDEDLSNGV